MYLRARRIFNSYGLTIAYILITLLIFSCSIYETNYVYVDNKESYQKTKDAISVLVSLLTFTSSINTALFAASITLAVKGPEWTREWTKFDSFLTVTALASGTASFYGTYGALAELLDMILVENIDIFNGNLQYLMNLQYYCLVFSALFIGLVFVRILDKR